MKGDVMYCVNIFVDGAKMEDLCNELRTKKAAALYLADCFRTVVELKTSEESLSRLRGEVLDEQGVQVCQLRFFS